MTTATRGTARLRLARAASTPGVQGAEQRVLVLLIALIPLVFVDYTIAGFALTGWAWLAGLLVVTPLILTRGLPAATVRRLTPYLLFLGLGILGLAWAPSLTGGVAAMGQLTAPAVAFALASRVQDSSPLLPVLRRTAEIGLLLALLLFAVAIAGLLPAAFVLSTRPTAIALVVLFSIATLGAGRSRTALLATLSVAASASTGSRTATAVLLVAVLLSPAWRLRWRGRTSLLLLATVGVLAFSQTQAFQRRFFFNEQGSLGDALAGSSSLNTAGRRELWPVLASKCGERPWLGSGPGAASTFSALITHDVLVQPHDDYLRNYCDVGLVGSVPFWGFFVICGAAGARSAIRRRDPLGAASGQLVVALMLLAVTDNVIIYTAHFMVPMAVVLGLALRGEVTGRSPAHLA